MKARVAAVAYVNSVAANPITGRCSVTDSPDYAGSVDAFRESASRQKFLLRLHEHGV